MAAFHVPNPGWPVRRPWNDQPLFKLDTENPLSMTIESMDSAVQAKGSELEQPDCSIGRSSNNVVWRHIKTENGLLMALQHMTEFLGIDLIICN